MSSVLREGLLFDQLTEEGDTRSPLVFAEEQVPANGARLRDDRRGDATNGKPRERGLVVSGSRSVAVGLVTRSGQKTANAARGAPDAGTARAATLLSAGGRQ
jgi:hypothetical protein